MLENVVTENKKLMLNVYNSFKKKINKIFVGRTSTKILDDILINCYGTNISLNKVSHIILIDFNTIKINLFDISLINIVKNSIIKSNLNLTVYILNNDIIINLPQINEKRRKELIKNVRCESENGRILIRKIRRESNLKIKTMHKNKIISIDIKNKMEEDVQDETDIYIRKINIKLIKKEKELLLI
ncbi:ribosome recycling factor [Enterobacteriaceae bacterium ET-AT1-13]|nr:ribosome recycling factor [Enterobacteriaceae bacterium ET-AT1-13]WGS66518.1 ribosome recycling factor [Enterobacteriaceae bacterium Cmel17]WMC17542.1 MAG: ribosome-recycling factor [Enterobacteriaceae bacterium Cmel21]WMC17749.1 MAG: ribosome recycling factor [Enterobacteriaceae bacterium PSmelAO3-2]WMC17953.1 MAG: ribosome recycling factor [Enterobacteriaceae bacterium PSmelAO3-1]WMC18155.1 MAG: ribosome recycling factor [Enterobacteriaceae bacterium PSmelAO1]